MSEDPDDRIVGRRVIVKSCEALKHGDFNDCVCRLLGGIVLIGNKRDTTPPTYEVAGGKRYLKRSQVSLLPRHGRGKRKR